MTYGSNKLNPKPSQLQLPKPPGFCNNCRSSAAAPRPSLLLRGRRLPKLEQFSLEHVLRRCPSRHVKPCRALGVPPRGGETRGEREMKPAKQHRSHGIVHCKADACIKTCSSSAVPSFRCRAPAWTHRLTMSYYSTPSPLTSVTQRSSDCTLPNPSHHLLIA